MPFKKGGKKPPGSGIKKGQKHTETLEIKAFVKELLDDPKYRAALKQRMIDGLSPAVERFLLERFVGKATEHIEVTGTGFVPLFTISGKGPDEGLNEEEQ
jgi:hypothetical protein